MDKLAEIQSLFESYKSCISCEALCEHRKQVVFGQGSVNADLMVIGEAPGREEDYKGEPFIGASGDVLNAALTEAGLARKDLYITNMVLCRPVFAEVVKDKLRKSNRAPTKDEVDACRERLLQEIYIVDPKLILLMGDTARTLVTRAKLSKIVGKLFELEIPGRTPKTVVRYPAIVTWHPAFLLRGSQQLRPGSPTAVFRQSVNLAAQLVRAGNHYAPKEAL